MPEKLKFLFADDVPDDPEMLQEGLSKVAIEYDCII
jgi:hypothetical protein